MLKWITQITVLICLSVNVHSQKNMLESPGALLHVRQGLSDIYSFDFEESNKHIEYLEQNFPGHPAIYFINALKIYWENFPLIPDNSKAEEFTSLMEKCVAISKERLEENEKDLEAVFFDLFARAFYMMFWADNGKPGKVIPHLNTLYRHTVEGFDLMYSFNEFYFTTGLYNYYIEAYPEKHPAYKSIVSLFQDGNKDLGLKQLKYCSDNAIFLRVEATFFLSLLYMNYENNPDSASLYMAKLYSEFPENPFYAGKYLEILIYNKKYFFAPVILKRLESMDNDFARLQFSLFNAMYLEKSEKKYNEAKLFYEEALKLSEKYGYFTEHYSGIALMGLGRFYKHKGAESKAEKYFREAGRKNRYDYVTDDR